MFKRITRNKEAGVITITTRELPAELKPFDNMPEAELAQAISAHWDTPGASIEGAADLEYELRLEHARQARNSNMEIQRLAEACTAHMSCPACRDATTGVYNLCRKCELVADRYAAESAGADILPDGQTRAQAVLAALHRQSARPGNPWHAYDFGKATLS